MKYHKQRFRHCPPETVGDCHRTAIACLLDLEPEDVPHFAKEHWEDDKGWERAEREFLRSKGYATVGVGYPCQTLDDFLKIMAGCSPGVYYLLGGQSRNGTNHTVIGCGGAIAHDPSLDDSGIVGPVTPEGLYVVTWLVPLHFTERAAA